MKAHRKRKSNPMAQRGKVVISTSHATIKKNKLSRAQIIEARKIMRRKLRNLRKNLGY